MFYPISENQYPVTTSLYSPQGSLQSDAQQREVVVQMPNDSINPAANVYSIQPLAPSVNSANDAGIQEGQGVSSSNLSYAVPSLYSVNPQGTPASSPIPSVESQQGQQSPNAPLIVVNSANEVSVEGTPIAVARSNTPLQLDITVESLVIDPSQWIAAGAPLTISRFPNLKALLISDSSLKDVSTVTIELCPLLQSIIIGDNCFSDTTEGSLTISDCPFLMSVSIGLNSFSHYTSAKFECMRWIAA